MNEVLLLIDFLQEALEWLIPSSFINLLLERLQTVLQPVEEHEDQDYDNRIEEEEEQGVENSHTDPQEYYIFEDLDEELKLERNRLSKWHSAWM